jgi:hypothetical protein
VVAAVAAAAEPLDGPAAAGAVARRRPAPSHGLVTPGPPLGRRSAAVLRRRARDDAVVFISHTLELRHLPPERSFVLTAEQAVPRAGAVIARKARRKVSREAVRKADVHVALVGFRYGTPSTGSPLCHNRGGHRGWQASLRPPASRLHDRAPRFARRTESMRIARRRFVFGSLRAG